MCVHGWDQAHIDESDTAKQDSSRQGGDNGLTTLGGTIVTSSEKAYAIYYSAAIEDIILRAGYTQTDDNLESFACELAQKLKAAADDFIDRMGE